jgi:hypothetical protein
LRSFFVYFQTKIRDYFLYGDQSYSAVLVILPRFLAYRHNLGRDCLSTCDFHRKMNKIQNKQNVAKRKTRGVDIKQDVLRAVVRKMLKMYSLIGRYLKKWFCYPISIFLTTACNTSCFMITCKIIVELKCLYKVTLCLFIHINIDNYAT